MQFLTRLITWTKARWARTAREAQETSRLLNSTPALQRLHCHSCGNPLVICPDNCPGRR